jgi:hypothetical protein
MTHVFEVNDDVYEKMRDVAAAEGCTMEELFATWTSELEARYKARYSERHPVFFNEDDWLRHLGISEERIGRINAQLAAEEDGEGPADAHAS